MCSALDSEVFFSGGSGTGVSPVCRLHDSHGRDARATTLETPWPPHFVCLETDHRATQRECPRIVVRPMPSGLNGFVPFTISNPGLCQRCLTSTAHAATEHQKLPAPRPILGANHSSNRRLPALHSC